ncbi:zinc knuckle CX2CX4HX4C containing protein [Tanacetum coccineum]|uniref:Zinc knuckle CX2CX4HX4C containing protein n=1 Tax=Tanacetum coccineum TaxID=301880 RepID=A0ABQ5A724_9ASTR
MKKLKESVHAIRVKCQVCEGHHPDKNCPLNEEVKGIEEVKYGEYGNPLSNHKQQTRGYNSNQSPKDGGGQILTETIKKYIKKASKRQAKQEEWLKTFCHSIEKSQNYHDEIIHSLESRVVTLAKEAKTKTDKNEDCKGIFTNDGTPLYTPFYYSPEEIKYFSANSGFSDDDESKIRLEQHAEEALIHKTMESLKKIKSNRPFFKEIRQSDEYPKYMKDLEQALADLGASISIMPFSMYKRVGIGNLETIKMNIELADNSKCISKGIVRNLLIKIDKFILPIDFIILDILEDFRMPVILGRPLLATAYAKVNVFKKSISIEVGNKKVIFKMKSDLPDVQNESILMIKSNMITEEDELMNIESDLFTYITNTCESCHLLEVDTDLFTYEVETKETYEEIAYMKRPDCFF